MKGMRYLNFRKSSKTKLLSSYRNANKGRPSFIGITGDPGVGKTEFINSFIEDLKGEKTILVGTSQEFSTTLTFHTVEQIFSSLIKFDFMDSKKIKTNKIEKFISSLKTKESEHDKNFLKYIFNAKLKKSIYQKFDNLKSQQRLNELNKLFSKILGEYSKKKQIIIIIENFQWIDKASKEFFQFLISNIKSGNIFVLFLSRGKESFAKVEINDLITLTNFDRIDSIKLISDILIPKKLPPKIISKIFKLSGGNPFIIKEIIHSFVLNDSIDLLGNNSLTVNEVLKQRFSNLTKDELDFLQFASIFGNDFPVKIIQKNFPGKNTKLILNSLINKEIIKKKMCRNALCIKFYDYSFSHILYKDYFYSLISVKKRAELHGKAGTEIENLIFKNTKRYLDLLLFHFKKSDLQEKYLYYLREKFKIENKFGYFDNAKNIMSEIIGIREKIPFTKSDDIEDFLAYAEVLGAMSQFDKGLLVLDKILKLGSKLLEESEYYLKFLILKGKLFYSKGKLDHSKSLLNKALSISENFEVKDREILGECYNVLGLIHLAANDIKAALKYFQKSFNIYNQLPNKFGFIDAKVLINIGICHGDLGEFNKALKCYKKSLKMLNKAFGPNNPFSGSLHINIGSSYYRQGDFKKALEQYINGYKIYLNIFGENHIYIASALNNIGLVLRHKKQYKASEKYLKKALHIRLKLLNPDHYYVAQSYQSFGELYWDMGKLDKAVDFYSRNLKILIKTNP
ncbi:MAG: tetratricopeptide repeat protein, partial [bacterium]|nr:tetratricopeptide repeat protein [bacterium]